VDRAARCLNEKRVALNGARILVLGVAYKMNIDDYRESPAITVIEKLLERGAQVEYFDPWVPRFRRGGLSMESLPALTPEAVECADLVMITTGHTNVDYEMVQRNAGLIFDTKNAMKDVKERDNIQVL